MISKETIYNNTEFPFLVLGEGAVFDFKKNFEGPILRVNNIGDLRDVVSYYTSIDNLGRMLVIEDLSFLSEMAEGLLLKFVEDSKLQLVFLSMYDKVSSIMLSRMKKVIKYQRGKTRSKFESISYGFQAVEELDNSHYFDRIRMMGKTAPMAYYFDVNIKKRRNKNRIVQFLK